MWNAIGYLLGAWKFELENLEFEHTLDGVELVISSDWKHLQYGL